MGGAARRGGRFAAFLAGTFAATAVFRTVEACRVGICRVTSAALAFFFACLAALLLAFASFRARFSTFFAARTVCFAASDRAAALSASAPSRCAAAVSFARLSDTDVATRDLAQKNVEVSLVPVARPVT
jgi:hypothetical protein